MKKVTFILLFISCIINAQSKKEYKHSIKGIKTVQIESEASIIVTTTETSELTLIDNAFSHKERPENLKREKEKTKGLTAIFPGGKDNTNGLGFSITIDGSTLIVRDLKSHFQRHGIQIKLPKTMNIKVDSGNLGTIQIEGFTSEVEAETNVGSINMKNVTGPITAHTNVGAITIDFVAVSQASPITISTNVSEIDVSIPANTNASLELKTRGTVYTNFDLQAPPKNGLKNVGGAKKIVDNINNGGVKITLRSNMGNIYLRKKE